MEAWFGTLLVWAAMAIGGAYTDRTFTVEVHDKPGHGLLHEANRSARRGGD